MRQETAVDQSADGWFGVRARRARTGGAMVGAMAVALVGALAVSGCQPTVKVEAPDKPIVINLNVKIEQDVRIRLERGVEDVMSSNPDLF
ncbi:YnbE family lipoprotein [Rhodospira trueperi]|uniref:YnbE-like lipoprotein n=1 Tax=Rhodospira trueperi TaxID=69960 RepID=A0A1G7D5C3_9PROT|nr:YnbE family lipoprotein [Rhodospira trueperi]SDE46731.1 YnbE-like lipoprotein [Rhodospira trueperi]